jgi:hypothetical protein
VTARASTLREKYAAEAKERMSEGGKVAGKGRPKQAVENLPPSNADSGKTRDQLGKLFGVSGKTVDYALSDGSPGVLLAPLVEAVELAGDTWYAERLFQEANSLHDLPGTHVAVRIIVLVDGDDTGVLRIESVQARKVRRVLCDEH